eukprot:CAMPEP_0177634064 /NCGR_PEP_ID=MMETSP0447-20121125/3172_1 /TAXON_ID=0 /ORGANISM="Stygamoeba regulata, Strain BSH-02190019" /LENGTH=421 /DNA_ID=CAMNT_0019135767 /DNA_START=161 /DNA_END=1426 /DNA_ORIENTATION=-
MKRLVRRFTASANSTPSTSPRRSSCSSGSVSSRSDGVPLSVSHEEELSLFNSDVLDALSPERSKSLSQLPDANVPLGKLSLRKTSASPQPRSSCQVQLSHRKGKGGIKERNQQTDSVLLEHGALSEELASLYDVEGEIGQGAYSKVFKVIKKETGEAFAAKQLKRTTLEKKKVHENLCTEVDCLRQVDHPNVVKLHHVMLESKMIWLVMEYLPGCDLFELVTNRSNTGYLPETFVRDIMRDVFGALVAMHSAGVAHRDLKPDNILWMEGRAVVIDFGLADILTPGSKFSTFVGTPSFLAPEVVNGKPYTCAVDNWSAGVTMYVCMAGYPPFDDVVTMNKSKLLDNIRNCRYDFKDTCWEAASVDSKDLISRLLAKDPAQRITAADALEHPWFQADLRAVRRRTTARASSRPQIKEGTVTPK